MGSPIKTLQYDLISSFTAELFDRFMDYKLLLKRAQTILSNRKSYRQRIGVANAIGTDVSTLLCLRAALRNEQTKIVEAVCYDFHFMMDIISQSSCSDRGTWQGSDSSEATSSMDQRA